MNYVCVVGSGDIARKDMIEIITLLETTIEGFLDKGIRLFYVAQSSSFSKLVIFILLTFKDKLADIEIVEFIGNGKVSDTKADKAIKLDFFNMQFKQIVSQSIAIISYTKTRGNAYDFLQLAQNQNIAVINILQQLK